LRRKDACRGKRPWGERASAISSYLESDKHIKQNSLLPPVIAMHPPSTIRSSIGSMTFPTESTRFNRRESNGVYMHIPISHHLSTQPPQHTIPCNLLDYPPKLTTYTHLLHHPLNPSIQSHHTMEPYKQTISSHHSHCVLIAAVSFSI
jgi:hypothetical protein